MRRRGILILVAVIVVSLVIIGCVRSSQKQLQSIKKSVITSETLTDTTDEDIWVYRYESNDYDYVYVYKNSKEEHPINEEKIQNELDRYINKQNLKTVLVIVLIIITIFFVIAF